MMSKLKCLIVLLLLGFSINIHAQSEKKFSSGTIFWGVFDTNSKDIVGNLSKYADVIELKRIDYDYYVYAKDKNGELFRTKYSKVSNRYIDETGTDYLINEQGNTIYILCLKPLHNMPDRFMILKITDVK